MFDSENVSLVTRIQAGAGVSVTHATNSEGENVWTAQVDQTWLTNFINANATGLLRLNDSDEARLRAVETKLGISSTTSSSPGSSGSSGSTGTTEVTVSAGVSALSGDITMSYSLVGLDGTALVTENLTGATGSTPAQIIMAMYVQMRRNNAMLKYMTPSLDMATPKLILTWKDAQLGSSFDYKITSQGSGDNVSFTATDY